MQTSPKIPRFFHAFGTPFAAYGVYGRGMPCGIAGEAGGYIHLAIFGGSDMRSSVICVVLAAVWFIASAAEADVINENCTRNSMYGYLPNYGNGGDVGWRPDSLLCFVSYDSGYRRIYSNLYQFDISSIPTGATVNSVQLRLHIGSMSSNDVSAMVSAYRVLASGTGQVSQWAEPTGTSASSPLTGVTGLMRDYPNSQAWDAQDYFGDHGPALDTVSVDNDTASADGFYYWDVTAAVQYWMENGENYGLAVISASTTNSDGAYRSFVARTGAAENRPILIIDYSTVAVPEPATVLLVGMGLLGGLRRAMTRTRLAAPDRRKSPPAP